jgi:GNAT superfamily N-acetyltransferase
MRGETDAQTGVLRIAPADPSHPDALALIAALSAELAAIYDHDDDGSGNFDPAAGVGERGAFLVGYVDAKPVACGAIRPLVDDVAELKRMFVAPAWRGRGFSRAMLTALESAAAELGYAAVRLETGDRQTAAIRLYESAGYAPTAKFGIYIDSARSRCYEKAVGR